MIDRNTNRHEYIDIQGHDRHTVSPVDMDRQIDKDIISKQTN